jgi:hypothetical protein
LVMLGRNRVTPAHSTYQRPVVTTVRCPLAERDHPPTKDDRHCVHRYCVRRLLQFSAFKEMCQALITQIEQL